MPLAATMATAQLAPTLGTVEDWQRVAIATHETIELRDVTISLAAREKHTELVRNSRPAPIFSIGELCYKYFTTFSSLPGAWRKGYVITGLDDTNDFYKVSKREADGSTHSETRVPVSMLMKLNTRRYTDGGLDMLIPDGRGIVAAIAGHSLSQPDDILSFKVRWHGQDAADDSYADVRDLMRDCNPMLRAYCKSAGIGYTRVLRQRKRLNLEHATTSA